MKTINYLLIFVMALGVITSCSKSNTDPGCGCNTDSIAYYVTYNNFGGSAYKAGLFYDTFQNQHDWFVSVGIPNTNNYGALLKICNPDLPSIRAITDTMSNKYRGIAILFSGKLTNLCEGESFGIQLPETLTLTDHVIIDSLKKN
jgi:hypothetical protein